MSKKNAICEAKIMKIEVVISVSKFLVEGVELFAFDKEREEDLKNKILNIFSLRPF